MKLFLKFDPKYILESTMISNPTIIDEMDEISKSVDLNLNKDVQIPKDVLDSFKLKNELNPDIWINGKLNPEVRVKLIQIAQDFLRDLNIPKEVKINDIIFTGSLANFNWSKFSDIDLHIELDFNQFDADHQIVEDYFWAQKAMWNQEHDISVFGFPIELYVQDTNGDLVATAIYSVMKDKWLKKPKREAFELDKKAIKTKAQSIIDKLKDIRNDYKDNNYKAVVDKIKKLKDKIKQMRNAGLERGGEFSLENLVFKVLRRTPFMDMLDAFKAKAYDKLMSVSEIKTLDETIDASEDDVVNLLYSNEGFFNFLNAKTFAKKYLGLTLISVIGQGGNGAAYLTSKNTKLKFTFNENEYEFAKRSIGKKTTYMADYYRAEEVGEGVYAIEMEYIDPLPSNTKEKLKNMFDAILHKKTNYDKNLKASVDNIKSKIGIWGNDLFNYDNYGIKNGQLATYDPVSEEFLNETDVLDNSSFKYKRESEDELVINAIYQGEIIGKLSMGFMSNVYYMFKDEFSEEQYLEMFPDDKLVVIGWVEIPQSIYRGQGIAKELMKRAIAKTKQQAYNRIYLNASPIKASKGLQLNDLVNFYKSFGFEEILHQGNNVQMLLKLNNTIDEDMSPQQAQHKIKKDLETKLGRRLLDSEWINFLKSGIIPKRKPQISLDPERNAQILQRQAELNAKYERLRKSKKL